MSSTNWEAYRKYRREEWIENQKGPDNFDTAKFMINIWRSPKFQ